MMQRPLLALAAALLCGCPQPAASGPADSGADPVSTGSASVSAVPEPTGAPEPSGGQAAGEMARWVGSWRSAKCGERTYPRLINLGADGKFSAQELVSPCVSPPGGPPIQCVWSGIVNYSGDWQVAGAGITLTQTAGDKAPGKISTASALSWSTAQQAPADAADATCLYQPHNAEPTPSKAAH